MGRLKYRLVLSWRLLQEAGVASDQAALTESDARTFILVSAMKNKWCLP